MTENVSVETFLSAIPNPGSVLYQPGKGQYGAPSYGLVCNGFVRYALGIPERVSTKRWNAIPGIRTLASKGGYSVDEMETCDVLYAFNDGRNHVAMITDLVRDENGHVTVVEVSEAVRPHCKRRRFTPEEYYEKYRVFALQRYDLLDEVPPFDADAMDALFKSGMDKTRPKITVDNGNKSNYLVGDTVVLSVFHNAPDTVELLVLGDVVKTLPVFGRARIPLSLERGYYTARLRNTGDEVHFAVMGAEISHTVENGMITVTFDSHDENSVATHLDFREAGSGGTWSPLADWTRLTPEEQKVGHFTRPIHPEGKNFKLSFRNKYGIWVHPMTKI